MLCHELRCIFVHVPKVAGQSIENFLIDYIGASRRQPERCLLQFVAETSGGPRNLAHLTGAEYVGLGFASKKVFDGYFKFAFVRNPWDRMVSEYRYRQHYLRYDFRSWVLHHWPTPDNYDEFLHVRPQYEFLHDENGSLLVDYVGHYERLSDDFRYACEQIRIDNARLPCHNVSTDRWWHRRSVVRLLREPRLELSRLRDLRKSYVAYYDAETRDLIARRFHADIAAFDYRFGD